MQAQMKSASKLLDRTYYEVELEGKAGMLSRVDAVSLIAKEMGVGAEKVGIVKLRQKSGSRAVLCEFFIYGTEAGLKTVHPKYLQMRLLTKEEREKIKQAKKKAATAAPAPEAKK